MKAAIYEGVGKVRVGEVEELSLGPCDVRVAVAYCGVCGTDLHIFEGQPGAADVVPPQILGHEMSGVVTQVGAGVRSVRPGMRVAVDPNQMCGACDFCRMGKGHFCTHMKGYGTTSRGGFAQALTVPEQQVYPIPDGLSLRHAALSETVSCCVHGIDLCGISAGDSVLVLGGGPIGLLMLQLARLQGAARVYLTEPEAGKREAALQLGAARVFDPTREELRKVMEELGENLDCVIECVGRAETMSQAVALAGKGATVMFFGLTPPDAEISVKPYQVFARELNLTASFINPYTFSRAIALLSEKRLDVESLLAHELPLEEITRAFTEPQLRKDGKILICIGGEACG